MGNQPVVNIALPKNIESSSVSSHQLPIVLLLGVGPKKTTARNTWGKSNSYTVGVGMEGSAAILEISLEVSEKLKRELHMTQLCLF